ncbi:MAG: glycerophosphodiester phosphodiesterase family protein [Bacteroidota bacterium]
MHKNTCPAFDKQGHRGSRGLFPENTIIAMLRAIDLGVTTLEMDVCFTSDKIAVLSHEPFLNHNITTLPNGQFIAANEEKKYNIYKMTYEELSKFDVGLKPHPNFPKQEKMAAVKPRLSDVISAVENYIKEKKLPPVLYNIETKTNPLSDNLFHPAPKEFVELLMKVITAAGIQDKATIQSFDFRTLQIIHQDFPAVHTAMLIEDYDKRTVDQQLTALGFTPTIYSPAKELVTDQLVQTCHQKKMKIIPWTVNEAAKITQLKALGVDGIITDYPNLFNE